MTVLEIILIIYIIILLIRIFIYHINQKNILKSMLEDLRNLQETQNKCTEESKFTKAYNIRKGQIYQIKKIKNKIKKLWVEIHIYIIQKLILVIN